MALFLRDRIVGVGQSNGITFFPSQNTTYPVTWVRNANLRIWDGNGTPGAWDEYQPNVNSSPGGGAYWGPEGRLLELMTADTGQPWFLNKFFRGSTGFVQNPGLDGSGNPIVDWSTYSIGETFSDFATSLAASTAALGSTIRLSCKLIYLIGGESDTIVTQAVAQKVEHEAKMLIEAIREITNSPEAICVIVLPKNSGPNGAWTVDVRNSLKRIATLPRNTLTDEDPYLSYAGTTSGSHLTPASSYQLGEDIFYAYRRARERLLAT
jgi:hypothetical protein